VVLTAFEEAGSGEAREEAVSLSYRRIELEYRQHVGAFIGLRPVTSEFSRAQRTLDGPRRSPVRSEPAPVLRGAGTARPVKEG